MNSTETIDDAQATKRLADLLPQWTCVDQHLQRRFKTGGWKATLMLVNTIGHVAEAAWHHPDLKVSYDSVEIQLTTHDAGGLTNKDFELAQKIEALVTWQPGKDTQSSLTGIPDDPRYEYIKYD